MEACIVLQRCARITPSYRNRLLRPGTKHPVHQFPIQFQFRHLSVSSQLRRDSSAVHILEVGPRDGLQNIKQNVATPIKVELIKRLAAAGLSAIEPTSFVSPKWIPQLADAADVMDQTLAFAKEKKLRFPVLVPNSKGLEKAIQNGASEVTVFVSASEGFSKKNTNCTVDEALTRAREVTESALSRGIAVRGVVSCIFSCPYDGPTPPSKVLDAVKSLLDMGCREVGLGDTLGVGTPKDVQTLLEILLKEVPANRLAGHFHDTYGQAVANVVRAYDMGLRTFDSSVAGLGGCPYAKGAKGNLATEDIAYTFEKSGIDTGIDLAKLVSVGEWISRQLGLPNGSRAGAALFAQQEPSVGDTSKTTSTSTSTSTSRKWEQVEDTGEYTVSRASNVVKITLTRPKNGNALTVSMLDGIIRIFKSLEHNQSVFHVVLAAEGKFFCTGMDLTSTQSDSSGSTKKSNDYDKLIEFFSVVEKAPQTTIAMIDGPCFGGGVGLAFSCDVRLVSSRTRFTLTEIKLGLSPAIISKYMIREWGIPFLREALLSGREVSPTELRQIGAVHGISANTQELEQQVEDYLDKLSNCAPRAATVSKELIRLGWTNPGGQKQEDKIRKTFDEMMLPGSEGEYGISQFRKKVKGVNWGQFWSGQGAKL